MADYISPKPVDPIAYQSHGFLHVACGCGRRATFPLGDFARVHRLSGRMKLYEMIARLRCETCGERPTSAKVTHRP